MFATPMKGTWIAVLLGRKKRAFFKISSKWGMEKRCRFSLILVGERCYFTVRQKSQERSWLLLLGRSACRLLGELKESWTPKKHQHLQNREAPCGRGTCLVVEKSALALDTVLLLIQDGFHMKRKQYVLLCFMAQYYVPLTK